MECEPLCFLFPLRALTKMCFYLLISSLYLLPVWHNDVDAGESNSHVYFTHSTLHCPNPLRLLIKYKLLH